MHITTKQELIDDVLFHYSKNKENFNGKIYQKVGKYSEAVINRIFGKWSNLCDELGLPYRKYNRYTKEEVLSDIKTYIESSGSTRRDDYEKNGKYSRCVFDKFFGGWNNILTMLGYDVNMNKKIEKEDVIKDMLALSEKYGNSFTAVIQRKESKYSQSTIDRLFGSFSNMLIELNLRSPFGAFISNEDIIKDISNLYDRFKTMSIKIIDDYSIVSGATVISRFGSVYTAYKIAGIPDEVFDVQSKLQKFVLNIINEQLSCEPILEKTFDFLINPKTNRKLKCDAYYENFNLIVEVDGQQHFAQYNQFGTLEEVQYRDSIKDELLKSNGFKILRIPYFYNEKQIKDALSLIIEQ